MTRDVWTKYVEDRVIRRAVDGTANVIPVSGFRQARGSFNAPENVEKLKTTARISQTYPLVGLCKSAGLPVPETEYEFHPTRMWRFDYAWPEHKLALEVDGGIWSANEQAKAAHAKPLAIIRDMEKGNEAVILGWRVLRIQPKHLFESVMLIERALQV